MNHVWQTLAGLAALAILGASAVVGFGLFNASARQDHLPGVAWMLHKTFERSVRLRAPDATAVPDDIRDPDRAELGARHFEAACAVCHALPGQVRSATAMAMNPRPPHISDAVVNWQPQHMFWIVREGVKMSGMPHWPAEHRDDEVWSVVAYLMEVRDSGTPDRTRPAADATCIACHGENGRSTNGHVPRLDILTPDQIADALTQYRDGRRPSGIMGEVTAGLPDSRIAALAGEFGNTPHRAPDSPDRSGPGARLASQGTDEIPACTACHGPGRASDAPISPSLAGQGRAYLETQLRLWRNGTRGGGPRAGLMAKAARNLDDEGIAALAAWYAGLPAPDDPWPRGSTSGLVPPRGCGKDRPVCEADPRQGP